MLFKIVGYGRQFALFTLGVLGHIKVIVEVNLE